MSSPPPNGATISSTPKKPTRTAVQRRQPTASPSSHGASAVVMIGAAKLMALAVASGSRLKLQIMQEGGQHEEQCPPQLADQMTRHQSGKHRTVGAIAASSRR